MKKFYFLFLFALIASISNLYAAEKTVTFDATVDKSSGTTLTKDGITLSLEKGTSTTSGSGCGPLDNGTDYRPYKGNILTISSEYTITKIVFTCAASTGTKKGGPDKFSVTKGGGKYEYKGFIGTWTGSAVSISFKADKQVQAKTIEVTYDAPDVPSCGVPTFSVEEGTYTEAQTITLAPGEGGEKVFYTINDGTEQQYIEPIKLEEEGIYKIAAYTAGTETLAKSATVTKTYIINFPLDEPYILCENAAWLTEGTKIIFVGEKNNKYYGLSGDADGVFLTGGLVTISAKELTEKDVTVKVFVVGRTANGVTFNTAAGYLAAGKTAKAANLSYAAGNEGDCFHWTVSVANGEATVVNADVTGDYNNLQFNPSAKTPRFGAYADSYKNGNLSIYLLGSTSSVSSMSAEGVKVFAAEGGVEVVADEAADVAVYTVAGQLVRQARVAEGSTLVNVAPGFYVVRANGTATKVIVR